MLYSNKYSSPLGIITIVSDGENIIGLWIQDQKYFESSINQEVKEDKKLPVLIAAIKWLDKYFSGGRPEVSEIPILLQGTDFQKSVWNILSEIPYGTVTTYGEIANKISAQMDIKKMSARAVGGAVGHNPISIIIPCHRVIGSNGCLTGYSGGIDKKIKLLELEKISITKKKVLLSA